MKLIVCLSEDSGMMFNRRRQSRDRVLCEDVVKTVRERGGMLYLSPYSAPLFDGMATAEARVSETYLADAGENDFCFCERESLAPCLENIQIGRAHV